MGAIEKGGSVPVVPTGDFDESIAQRERDVPATAQSSAPGSLSEMFVSFLKPPESPPPGAGPVDGGGAVTGAVAGVMSAGDFLAAKLDESMMALIGATGPSDDAENPPIVREIDERTAAARKEHAERPPLTFGQKLRRVVAGLAVVLVLIALYVSATMYQVWSLSSVDDAEVGAGPFDAIVVLGAAQYNGEPSPVFAGRLDRAHELYDQGFSDIIITTGSKQAGDTYTEGYAGYEYLRDRGVPDDSIRVIVDGTNTWEELSASAAVMEDEDRTSALMVSDPYHNYRIARIADEVGLDPYVAPTDTESTVNDYVRETVANSIGQITGFRRLSNWSENR